MTMSEDRLKAKEKWLERDQLKPAIEKAGGLCLKLFSPWFTGLPDRMILLPGGNIFFAELKTTGKKLSPRQKYVKRQLEKLGFLVFEIADADKLQQVIDYAVIEIEEHKRKVARGLL